MTATSPEPMIGCTVAITASSPATEDQAGYEALTWTTITGITEIPELSRNANDNTLTLLATGVTQHYNGARGVNPFDLPYVYDASDAGQDLVRSNYNGAAEVSIRIDYTNSAVVEYVQAVLGNLRTSAATADGYHGETINVRPISLATTVED